MKVFSLQYSVAQAPRSVDQEVDSGTFLGGEVEAVDKKRSFLHNRLRN